ncbi:S8 family serine peptidase [Aquimarina addita]|uniref:S8 family serine peptidase n=1 Tax=Aquimarina addita TaxID=870485 RepID=A0ABP6UMK0_9FLAO
MKKYLMLFFFITQIGFSQEEDAWVYFTEKENTAEAIANPLTILTQQAIDRKELHNVVIDERDVPVTETYISQLKNINGVTVLAKSKWFNCVFLRGELSIIRDLQNLSFVSHIDYADNSLDTAVKFVKPTQEKNESIYSKFGEKADFNYGSAAAQIQQLRADYMHQQGYTGAGMIIAVMDAGFPGVDTNDGFKRARDEGRILDGYNFVSRSDDEFAITGSSHGTQTFSDIAGYIDGEFIGTAPDASYYLFVTEDVATEGPKEEALWVEAVERADSLGVHVINTSLGYSQQFDNPAYDYKTSDMDGQTTFISRGANIAFDKGMLLVTSAGNSGGDSWGIITAPGDAPGTLTVGAIDQNGEYAGFSSIGPTADNRIKPDVVARGLGAAVLSSANSVSSNSGTSFSSPIMAGAVTCLWQALPQLSNDEIIQVVRASGSQYNTPTNQLGYGIPDFQSMLEDASLSVDTEDKVMMNVYPNPVQDQLFFTVPEGTTIQVTVFTIDGRMIQSEQLTDQKYISLQDLAAGLYVVETISENSRYIHKITK